MTEKGEKERRSVRETMLITRGIMDFVADRPLRQTVVLLRLVTSSGIRKYKFSHRVHFSGVKRVPSPKISRTPSFGRPLKVYAGTFRAGRPCDVAKGVIPNEFWDVLEGVTDYKSYYPSMDMFRMLVARCRASGTFRSVPSRSQR